MIGAVAKRPLTIRNVGGWANHMTITPDWATWRHKLVVRYLAEKMRQRERNAK